MKTIFIVFLGLLLAQPILAQSLNHVVKLTQSKGKETPVSYLYLNCGNPMYIKLGNHPEENVSFKAIGAEVIAGASHGEMTVVPNSRNTTIQIFDKEVLWATESFMVNPIPPPSVQIFINDEKTPFDNKNAARKVEKLLIKVEAEAEFAKAAPNDANYSIKGVEVSLARGKTLIGKVLKIEKSEIDLSEMSKLMQPNDRIIIEMKGIERTNFKGEKEAVHLDSYAIYSISIQ